MMKKNWRLRVTLAMLLALTVLAAGCGGAKEDDYVNVEDHQLNGGAEETDEDSPVEVYDLGLVCDDSSFMVASDMKSDLIMQAMMHLPGSDGTENGSVSFHFLDMDMNYMSDFTRELSENQSLVQSVLGADGTVYGLYYENGGDWYDLDAYSLQGDLQWSLPLGLEAEDGYTIWNMQAGPDGELFVLTGTGIEVYLADGTCDSYIDLNGVDAEQLYLTQYGELMVDDYTGDVPTLRLVNLEEGVIEPTVFELPFDLSYYRSGSSFVSDMILMDGDGIYTYDVGDESLIEQACLDDYGLDGNGFVFYNSTGIFFFDENTFYTTYCDEDAATCYGLIFHKDRYQ